MNIDADRPKVFFFRDFCYESYVVPGTNRSRANGALRKKSTTYPFGARFRTGEVVRRIYSRTKSLLGRTRNAVFRVLLIVNAGGSGHPETRQRLRLIIQPK